jgi:mRNA interferase MazF
MNKEDNRKDFEYFDQWNETKKQTHASAGYLPFYHKRQIRWCRLGVNVGFEQDGSGTAFARPILVLKAFNRNVCLVIPLSTSTKENPYYKPIGLVEGREAAAIISQIRLIDTKRLDQLITTLDKNNFNKIRKAVKGML